MLHKKCHFVQWLCWWNHVHCLRCCDEIRSSEVMSVFILSRVKRIKNCCPAFSQWILALLKNICLQLMWHSGQKKSLQKKRSALWWWGRDLHAGWSLPAHLDLYRTVRPSSRRWKCRCFFQERDLTFLRVEPCIITCTSRSSRIPVGGGNGRSCQGRRGLWDGSAFCCQPSGVTLSSTNSFDSRKLPGSILDSDHQKHTVRKIELVEELKTNHILTLLKGFQGHENICGTIFETNVLLFLLFHARVFLPWLLLTVLRCAEEGNETVENSCWQQTSISQISLCLWSLYNSEKCHSGNLEVTISNQ